MSKKSLSAGGIYYLIYNVLNIAFPFLTGIYVSRVLLPESIGTVAAAQNLAQYFVILAFLGIPTYGLREISKTRNDREERNRIYSELVIINLVSTCVFFSIYLILIFSIAKYRSEVPFYLVTGILIALNALNISWLYEGLEEFKFISIRNLLFKVISFTFLILLVKTSDDVLRYAFVTVIGTAGNYIVNVIYAPRFVKFTIHGLNFRRHLKPIVYLVAVNLAIELYSLVDITMMNFICDKENIAFYKYGHSIERILLQIVNTFTMVLVPRISFYYKEGKKRDFNLLLSKAFILIIFVALPMIVGLYFTSDFLMVMLYGNSYIVSSKILKLLSILLLISPVGYLLGSRVMLVTGNENKMIIPVGVGAIVNIVGNAILIPQHAGFGAAIASVVSELVVMIIYVNLGRKYFKLLGVSNSIIKIIASNFIMCVYLFIISRTGAEGWYLTGAQILGAILTYTISLLILKEKNATEYFQKAVGKIRHRW